MNQKKGFTIVELVVGLLILSVALIPLFTLFSPQVKVTTTDKTRSVLLALAQKKTDETINTLQVDYEATLATSGNFSVEGYTAYRYSLVTNNEPANNNLTKTLSVIVWDYNNGNSAKDAGEIDLTLDTRVAKREL